MADWNGMLSKRSGLGVGGSSEEFEEQEVWDVVNERSYSNSTQEFCSSDSSSGASLQLQEPSQGLLTTLQVPMKSNWFRNQLLSTFPIGQRFIGKVLVLLPRLMVQDRYVNYNGDDDDDDMVPPHEWMARKLARSQISSFSVCEGIGRTLKGRDLSKVRNAILTKTGFLE